MCGVEQDKLVVACRSISSSTMWYHVAMDQYNQYLQDLQIEFVRG